MICYSEVCDDLDDLENGCVIRTGNPPFETAFYTCNEGYTLNGKRKRDCEISTEMVMWSETKPTCVKDVTEPRSR